MSDQKRFTLYTQILNGVGTVAGLIVIGFIIADPTRLTHPDWVVWLIVVVGGMHTFEEYTFPGGFTAWFNTWYFNSPDAEFPLSARKAFYTDAVAAVVILGLVAVLGTHLLWLTMGFACIMFINGCWHLTSAITKGIYSPGAVSSALFNIPLGAYVVYFYSSRGFVGPLDVLIAYAIGLMAHIAFFAQMRRDIRSSRPEMSTP